MVEKKKKKSKFNAVRYTKVRKSLLKEEMKLVYEREKLNKQIRVIKKELNSWDKYLISEE